MPHLPFFRLARPSGALAFLLCLLGLAVAPFNASADYVLSPEEGIIAGYMVDDPGQQRPAMQLDPILSLIARERAEDMARRDYFAHTNPDGFAANFIVADAGYALPAWWGSGETDNFIESIAAGHASAANTWLGWMNSPSHKNHILALTPFYQDQTSYGVGYAYSANSTYRHYWVIITAPPSTPQPRAALAIQQNVPSAMTAGQIYSVSISMLNTGSETWTPDAGFRLASITPDSNWGVLEVLVPADVTPGSAVTFSFNVTAPATPGTVDFQWQMEQLDGGRFGEISPALLIPVSAPPPSPPPSSGSSSSYSSGSNNYWAASSSSSSKKKKDKKKKKKKKKSKKK